MAYLVDVDDEEDDDDDEYDDNDNEEDDDEYDLLDSTQAIMCNDTVRTDENHALQ